MRRVIPERYGSFFEMMKKKKIRYAIMAIALLMIILLAIPALRSRIVMRIYSEYNEKESLLTEKNIRLEIPSGEGWYPFVMTFCDNHGFSTWMGEELKLTILYNFPEFRWNQRCSEIYNPKSEYYNSFYGAYIVEREGGTPYGFDEDGNCIPSEVAEVPQYDFWKLVLEDFGLSKEERCFEWTVNSVKENIEYAGDSGWTRISAKLKVNGIYHEADEYVMSYLQYGRPEIRYDMKELAPVEMEGLIYGKYYPEINVSIFFYCVAMNEDIIRDVDERLLSQSFLEIVDFSK